MARFSTLNITISKILLFFVFAFVVYDTARNFSCGRTESVTIHKYIKQIDEPENEKLAHTIKTIPFDGIFGAKGTHSPKVIVYSASSLKPKNHININSCPKILENKTMPMGTAMPVKGDKETFHRYLNETKKNHSPMKYIEWGCGGSTFIALQYADHVVSIDSSETWCNKVMETDVAQCSVLMGKMHFICVDAGKTKPVIADPVDRKNYDYDLYTKVMEHFEYSPDFVFIDGRIRVASALASMKISKQDSITLVHDYYDRPGIFADLEKFFATESTYSRSTETMAVFKKRTDYSQADFDKAWQKHRRSLND